MLNSCEAFMCMSSPDMMLTSSAVLTTILSASTISFAPAPFAAMVMFPASLLISTPACPLTVTSEDRDLRVAGPVACKFIAAPDVMLTREVASISTSLAWRARVAAALAKMSVPAVKLMSPPAVAARDSADRKATLPAVDATCTPAPVIETLSAIDESDMSVPAVIETELDVDVMATSSPPRVMVVPASTPKAVVAVKFTASVVDVTVTVEPCIATVASGAPFARIVTPFAACISIVPAAATEATAALMLTVPCVALMFTSPCVDSKRASCVAFKTIADSATMLTLFPAVTFTSPPDVNCTVVLPDTVISSDESNPKRPAVARSTTESPLTDVLDPPEIAIASAAVRLRSLCVAATRRSFCAVIPIAAAADTWTSPPWTVTACPISEAVEDWDSNNRACAAVTWTL